MRNSGPLSWFLCVASVILIGSLPGTTSGDPLRAAPANAPSRARLSEAYGRLPMLFEANQGQTDSQVKFLARGRGYTLFLTSTDSVMLISGPERTATGETPPFDAQPGVGLRAALCTTMVGANPTARVTGQGELPGKANYFIGRDPAKWQRNVSTYARVRYHEIYPGIDVAFYGNQSELEYDFIVRPGADPGKIALAFQGADRLEVDAAGDLVLHTAAGAIRHRRPVIYQEVDGVRRAITGGYALGRRHEVGFRVAAYDRRRPLVIDPVLVYSTYLGGSGLDSGVGIAVDAAGATYVTGHTASADFPTTPGTLATAFGGLSDAFVAKLDPTGTAIEWSTYLGGSDDDQPGQRIAVDDAGNVYVAGGTESADFPTTPGAFDETFNGVSDAFVSKLDSTGSTLVYSTYLGGSSFEQNGRGTEVVVDDAGSAYVTGMTLSADFPTTPGAFDTTLNGGEDVFMTKLDPSGSALVYSTYLGGSGVDQGISIALDVSGSAYVTGRADSANFPTTPGAFDTTFNGASDAFVTRLDPTGSALVYSTYLGGSGTEFGFSIALDGGGSAYVTGRIFSADFPTTPGAFDVTFHGGGSDGFVAKLNSTGSALAYSTYLGGSGDDHGAGIAVDGVGSAFVAGSTNSADFPTTSGAFSVTFNGGLTDAFVAQLDPTGSALGYSTYLGGSDADFGSSIAVDNAGSAYVTGRTSSANLPTTAGAFDTTYHGGPGDAFVTKIGGFVAMVDIDIKPGTRRNSVNLRSKGVIRVAILTTADFDASTVDPDSVRFGPAGAIEAHGRGHAEDVGDDGDGDADLVLHFRTQDTGIQCGDTAASLTGNTFGGQLISGTDSVKVVGC